MLKRDGRAACAMTTRNNEVLTAIQRLATIVNAIQIDVDGLGTQVRYVKNYIDAVGSMEGTIAGLTHKLQAIQNSLAGQKSSDIKRDMKTSDQSTLMELGRMPLPDAMEFLKEYNAKKANGSITPRSIQQGQGGDIGSRGHDVQPQDVVSIRGPDVNDVKGNNQPHDSRRSKGRANRRG